VDFVVLSVVLLFFVALLCCAWLRSAQQALGAARNIALIGYAFLGQQPAVLAVVGIVRR
jgi:hypothetical protein